MLSIEKNQAYFALKKLFIRSADHLSFLCCQNLFLIWLKRAISMLVTDIRDEMCWWQLWDAGDGFGRFCHQHPLSFNISVGQQHPKDVTNIEILSVKSKNCHQYPLVTNIYVAGACSQCSFGPAWGSIETTTIGKTHTTLAALGWKSGTFIFCSVSWTI